MTPPQPLIRIERLHKHYGQGATRNHVLKGVNLEIHQGEFIAIVGASGSGKTTLLNVLGALDRGYDGFVEITGHDLQKLSDRRLSQLRNEAIGFIFQSFNLLPHLSCAQNVAIPSYFRPHAGASLDARARDLLAAVGLVDKLNDLPTELSGGQRQRVCIARALFNAPNLILCDEPTGSLDRETGQQIIDLFRQLNRDQRLTFVIVTHDENLSRTCDRIIRIADGMITLDAATADLPLPADSPQAHPLSAPTPAPAPTSPWVTRPAISDSLDLLSAATTVLPGWLPDACDAPLSLRAGARSIISDGHTLSWGDGATLDLDRPFSCLLSQSADPRGVDPQSVSPSATFVHLTLRQQTAVDDPEDPLRTAIRWHELTLSAPSAAASDAFDGLPTRAEAYTHTDEASLRTLVAALRAAMRRQGAEERWF
jgi:putative ABC transport system ATP-binding protein